MAQMGRQDKSCNMEGKKLIELCELNNFEMLNEMGNLDRI
jgi:hypothetical protein